MLRKGTNETGVKATTSKTESYRYRLQCEIVRLGREVHHLYKSSDKAGAFHCEGRKNGIEWALMELNR